MEKGIATIVSDSARIAGFLGQLGKNGRFTEDHFQRIQSGDEPFIQALVDLANNAGIAVLPTEEQQIYNALGTGNYFGVREWSKIFWLMNVDRFPKFDWPIELLDEPCPFWPGKRIRETHWVYLGVNKFGKKPTNFTNWQKLIESKSKCRLERSFISKIVPAKYCWYLTPITPAPSTYSQYPWNIQKVIPDGYRMMSSGEWLCHAATFTAAKGIYPAPFGLEPHWWISVACNDNLGKNKFTTINASCASNEVKTDRRIINLYLWSTGSYDNLGAAITRCPGK